MIDPSFGRYRLGLARVEQIASSMRWTERPIYFGDGTGVYSLYVNTQGVAGG